MKVRKAVIPVAGFGTRMLPITKTVSKVMLPIVDKPILQVVVEELVESGIQEIIIVRSSSQNDVVDYFGAVEAHLKEHLGKGNTTKQAQLEALEKIQKLANFTFVTQNDDEVYGTGTPVLCAEPYLGDEPFIYTFADDFFIASHNSHAQLIESYERYGAPIIGCQKRTADADYDRYGYVGGTQLASGEIDVQAIVEHPGKTNRPGDLASLGGFVVTPEVLLYLHKVRNSLPEDKEFYFHTALSFMVADHKQVVAKEVTDAIYYDTGNKLEYMKTSVAMAARHPEIGKEFKQFLKGFVSKENDHES